MLRNCLASVISTRMPEDSAVSIIVVDNDEQKSGLEVVSELSQGSIPISYIHEPRRGIPIARNKALDHALANGVDYLVFIDDDETVTNEWLEELFACAKRKGGMAVIHGRVVSECPKSAPEYLALFFQRNRAEATGRKLTSCATDNVLIPMCPIVQHGLRFDETRPLAGGTDTLFFSAAHRKGVEIFSCAEAVVIESVPLSRITVRWLSKRKFRAGVDMGRRKVSDGRGVFSCIGSSALQMILNSISAALFVALIQRHLAVKKWLQVCRCAGTIQGALGRGVDSYQTTDGH